MTRFRFDTARKIIGAAMIATPFVAITAGMWISGGAAMVVTVWAFVLTVGALIAGGLALLNPKG